MVANRIVDINEILAKVEFDELGIDDEDEMFFSEDDLDDNYFPPSNSRGKGVTTQYGGYSSNAWSEMKDFMGEVYEDG